MFHTKGFVSVSYKVKPGHVHHTGSGIKSHRPRLRLAKHARERNTLEEELEECKNWSTLQGLVMRPLRLEECIRQEEQADSNLLQTHYRSVHWGFKSHDEFRAPASFSICH